MNPGTAVTHRGREYVVATGDAIIGGMIKIVRDVEGRREAISVSAGDVIKIADPPAYSPGQRVRYRSTHCEVVSQDGGKVRVKFTGYYHVSRAGVVLEAGNVEGDVQLADLVSDQMGRAA
jgi:hypothetical protein